MWLARRRARQGKAPFAWPSLDLRDARVRGWVLLFAIATVVNTLLVTAAGVEAIHYMDSPTFCGQVCHTQMEPHFVQWQRGPAHTKVACAGCHIGTGAQGFVMAKTRGTAQLIQVITGKYPTPVPSPIEYRPPTDQTCGKCHGATRWTGERRRLFTDIGDDQANTPTQTLLTLLVGGTRPDGSASGFTGMPPMEWRSTTSRRTSSRGKIPWVRVKNAKGEVKEFVVDGFDAAKAGGERRRMDCVDCHNKVAHPFARQRGKSGGSRLRRWPARCAAAVPATRGRQAVEGRVPHARAGAHGNCIRRSRSSMPARAQRLAPSTADW